MSACARSRGLFPSPRITNNSFVSDKMIPRLDSLACCCRGKNKTTYTHIYKETMSEVYLGGEPSFLDPHVEKEGVAEILAVLTSEEKARMPDPAMPIRHLRAEKGDVAKAAEKLKDALEWRKTFDADALVKATTPDGSKEYKQLLERENVTGKIYIRGYDKDGRALMYMRPGRENTNALEDQMKHLVWNLEKAIACTNRKSRELGAKEPLEKVNLVIDYEGFTLGNAPSLTASRYTLDILQKHFPERMHRAYVLNPPFVFQAFWTIVKPFVDPISKEKIVFCSGEDGVRLLHDNMDQIDKLEPVAKGSATKAFDSKAYLKLPFHVSFDEDVEADDNENDDPANDEGR